MAREPWQTRVLELLEHPVNLMIANLVWFALVLPIVTWLPATVALAYSLDRWFRDGDDRMIHNILVGWRLQWRRTLPLGVVSGLAVAVLAANGLFLSTRAPGVATVLLGGTGALGLMWLALHLWLVPVAALHPDLPVTRWVAESAALAVANPLTTVVLITFTVLLVAVLAAFWTFVPFFSAGLVAGLGVWAVRRTADA